MKPRYLQHLTFILTGSCRGEFLWHRSRGRSEQTPWIIPRFPTALCSLGSFMEWCHQKVPHSHGETCYYTRLLQNGKQSLSPIFPSYTARKTPPRFPQSQMEIPALTPTHTHLTTTTTQALLYSLTSCLMCRFLIFLLFMMMLLVSLVRCGCGQLCLQCYRASFSRERDERKRVSH